MIEFSRTYEFENEFGAWKFKVETGEHPTRYGNGMLLVITPIAYPEHFNSYDLTEQFDIRYNNIRSTDDIHELVMHVLEQSYGVTEADYNDIKED